MPGSHVCVSKLVIHAAILASRAGRIISHIRRGDFGIFDKNRATESDRGAADPCTVADVRPLFFSLPLSLSDYLDLHQLFCDPICVKRTNGYPSS